MNWSVDGKEFIVSGLFVIQKYIFLLCCCLLFPGPDRQNKKMKTFVKVFAVFFITHAGCLPAVIWVLPSLGSALLCTCYPKPTPLSKFLLAPIPAQCLRSIPWNNLHSGLLPVHALWGCLNPSNCIASPTIRVWPCSTAKQSSPLTREFAAAVPVASSPTLKKKVAPSLFQREG